MSLTLINPLRETLILKGRHCKWLIDGVSFLEHLADLSAIKLVARCGCRVDSHVSASRDPATPQRWNLHCADCGAGGYFTPHATKGDDVEPLLKTFRWALCCTDCGEPVKGNNDQTAVRFTVSCSCTTREYLLSIH